MGGRKRDNLLKNLADKAKSTISDNQIYFAHTIDTYNTKEEKNMIKLISDFFPEMVVYNPNQSHNQANYQTWKKEIGSGMKYYFDVILPKMKVGIYLPFSDGMIGAGVFGEMKYLENNLKSIFEISDVGIIKRIKNLDSAFKLSVDETRKRIYT
jgi:hypothetical protein